MGSRVSKRTASRESIFVEQLFSGAFTFDNYVGDWDTSKLDSNYGSIFQSATAFHEKYECVDSNSYSVDPASCKTVRTSWMAPQPPPPPSPPPPLVPLTDSLLSAAITYCLQIDKEYGICPNSEHGQIADWDVSGVTNFNGAFKDRSSFNGDISKWDVSSATSMSEMFMYASRFDQDIGNWTTASVTYMDHLFLS